MPPKVCYKCKVGGEGRDLSKGSSLAVATRHHYACKDCFLGSIMKSFRGQLHKLKLQRKYILFISVSGGCCSVLDIFIVETCSALVALFHEAMSVTRSKLDYQVCYRESNQF